MVLLDRAPESTGEWECMECGYIEEGTRARRPAECLECAAPSDAIEFFAFNESDEEEWDSDDLTGDADEYDDEEEDRY